MSESRKNIGLPFQYDQFAEQIANARAHIAQRHAKVVRAELDFLLSLLSTSKVPELLLDIGSATGGATRLACANMGIIPICLDKSLNMLKQAKPISSSQNIPLHRVCGIAEALPFVSCCFMVATLNSVVHHIEKRSLAFRETLRVLQPGGILGICTLSHDQIRQHHLAKLFPRISVLNQQRYPSIELLLQELKSVGFETVDVLTSPFCERILTEQYRASILGRYGSVLHLLSETEFEAGIQQMERLLSASPSVFELRVSYTFIGARTPN